MNGWLSAQTHKSLADIFRRKAHSLAIVLAILISVGGFTAVNVAGESLASAYAFSLRSRGAGQEVTVAVNRTDPSLLAAIARQPNVAALQVSTMMESQWQVAAAPGHVDLTVIGYADPGHVPLTPFQLVAGRYPGIGEIVMEFGDRGLQQFSIGEMVTLDTAHGSSTLHIVGIARTPGTNPAITGKAVGYMSTTALNRLPAFAYVPGPVQRQPWRAALSIMTIAIAATCFLVVQSLASSVNGSIGSVWGYFRADVEVYVVGQQSYHEIFALLRRVPNVGRIERVGWFGSQTAWGKIAVWGVEPDSRMYHHQVRSGRWFAGRHSDEVLISDNLAARADLHTGSTLTLPGPDGNRTMTFTVIGTVRESVDDLSQVGAAVLPVDDLYRLEGASASHIGDFTNRVLVQSADRSPAAVDRLTRAIDRAGRQAAASKGGSGPVAEVFAFHDEVVRHQRSFLPVYALLFAVALVVAVVGILGLADALGASVVERRRDIGLFRSLGATGRRVATVFWIEGAALSGLAWIIWCAAGIPLAYLFVDLFRHAVMPTEVQFERLTLAVMVAVTLVLSTVATVVPAHRAAALHAGDLLRGE